MTIYSSLAAKVSSQQVDLTSVDFIDLKELFIKTTTPKSDPSPRINDNTGERNEQLDNAVEIDRTLDTCTYPNLSLPRDVSMIETFLASPSGQIFTNNQNAYQKFNTFSETRIPTSDFIISNTKKPHSHTSRPSNNAGKVLLLGDSPQSAPGHAGRLQMETSDFVINTTGVSNLTSFMGATGFAAGILGGVQRAAVTAAHNIGQNLLNNAMANVGLVAGDVLRGIGNIAVGGSLGVDQRPELMINGQYYSVILNQIQQKSYKDIPRNPATGRAEAPNTPSAGARIGNALGQLGTRLATSAATSLLSMGTNALSGRSGGNITDVLINGTVSGEIASRVKSQLRATGESTARHRYFINLAKDPPTGLAGLGASFVPNSSQMTVNRYWVGIEPIDDQIHGFNAASLDYLTGIAMRLSPPSDISRDDGLTDGLSASYAPTIYQFMSDRARSISTAVQAGITTLKSKRGYKFTALSSENPKKIHYIDTMNLPVGVGAASTVILPIGAGKYNTDPVASDGSDETTDYIDVIFTNVVFQNEVHVRSMISNISEKVNPQYEGSTRYIGRVEKPIVYGGVDRTVSFELMLHAFSEAELKGIWEKVNFITSLTYPQKYLHGFMVPPLAQITIGNLYRRQSGYITSLTKTIDDKYSWDINISTAGKIRNNQLPMTIKLSVEFTIIDNQRYAGDDSRFHANNLWEPDPPKPAPTTTSTRAAPVNNAPALAAERSALTNDMMATAMATGPTMDNIDIRAVGSAVLEELRIAEINRQDLQLSREREEYEARINREDLLQLARERQLDDEQFDAALQAAASAPAPDPGDEPQIGR